MRLGKRTAKLVREAAIAGFVAGNCYGPPRTADEVEYPSDPEIWVFTLRVARKFPDIYPTLKTVVQESEELAEDDRRARAAADELLRHIQGGRS